MCARFRYLHRIWTTNSKLTFIPTTNAQLHRQPMSFWKSSTEGSLLSIKYKSTKYYYTSSHQPVYEEQILTPCTWVQFLCHDSSRRGLQAEQSFEWGGVCDRRAACEILTNKRHHLVWCKIILCHKGYVAIHCFPKFHLLGFGGVYVNHLSLLAAQKRNIWISRKDKEQTVLWARDRSLELTVLLGSYCAWAAASISSNSTEDLWPTRTTCFLEGTENMSAPQHIRGTAIAISFNLVSKTACTIIRNWGQVKDSCKFRFNLTD